MLLEHVGDLKRAHDYASKVDEVAVWSEVGHAELAKGQVADAIASYLRANDASNYAQVTEKAKSGEVGQGDNGWWGVDGRGAEPEHLGLVVWAWDEELLAGLPVHTCLTPPASPPNTHAPPTP